MKETITPVYKNTNSFIRNDFDGERESEDYYD